MTYLLKGVLTARLAATLLATLLLAAFAWAGPLEDADRAFRAGDYQTAITLLLKAQEENPNDVRVYGALGKTYRKLGDNDSARDAYTEFLRRDPQLKTLKSDADRQAFLSAFKSIGGQVPSGGADGQPSGQGGSPTTAQEIFSSLSKGNVFVVPPLRNEIDAKALESAVQSVQPVKVKVLVVNGLGGYRSREELAEDIRKRLNLNPDAVVVVATPKGVSASSGRLSNDQLNAAIQGAGLDTVLANQGPTEMIATAIRAAARASKGDASADFTGAAGTIGLIGLGVGGFFLYQRNKREKEMAKARERANLSLQRVLQQLSYVDGYLDLLPKDEPATKKAKDLRASGYEKYEVAKGFVKTAKSPAEVDHALPILSDADKLLIQCREQIDLATGGTGVAMSIPELPSLATDVEKARQYRAAEDLRSAEERARLQQQVEQLPAEERGVSFFSGQPMPASVLVPVTVVIAGQRRTVMATPEEAALIQQGQMPQVRAFRDPVTGQFVPWYEYNSYDPYRDYYAYDGRLLAASVMTDLAVLTAIMGAGVYGHYGPWGYHGYGWGMPAPQGGYVVFESYPTYPYHQDVWVTPPTGGYYGGAGGAYGGYASQVEQQEAYQAEHAGGMDLFGQQGYQEQSSSFDFGGSSDSSSSWSSSDSSSSSSSWDSGSSSSDSGSSSDFGGSSSSDW